MQRLRVRGKILGRKASSVEFRTSLFPVPGEGGRYLLLVNNRVQREAGITIGSVAEFSLEADLEPRPAELPDELDSLLDDEPKGCASTTTLLANPCGAKSANG